MYERFILNRNPERKERIGCRTYRTHRSYTSRSLQVTPETRLCYLASYEIKTHYTKTKHTSRIDMVRWHREPRRKIDVSLKDHFGDIVAGVALFLLTHFRRHYFQTSTFSIQGNKVESWLPADVPYVGLLLFWMKRRYDFAAGRDFDVWRDSAVMSFRT